MNGLKRCVKKEIKFSNFSWINISNPNEGEIQKLAERHKFHPLDLQECLKSTQRTKIDAYHDYIFLITLFPIYNRQTRAIESGEIDFFISRKYLITIHRDNFLPLNDFFHVLEIHSEFRNKFSDFSPEPLLYEILNKLFLYCFPMIDHLILDCDDIEKAIFSDKMEKMISEILLLRRNITDFRKLMQVHKNVLKKLIQNLKDNPLYVMKKTDVYFESLVEYDKELWDTLDNLKERIEALQETNESQISFKLSHIMKILTIISVITFPITLIAAIFGMNTLRTMPFVDHPFGFWIVIAFMLSIASGMLIIFKKNKWF